jgi:hypothetical protein
MPSRPAGGELTRVGAAGDRVGVGAVPAAAVAGGAEGAGAGDATPDALVAACCPTGGSSMSPTCGAGRVPVGGGGVGPLPPPAIVAAAPTAAAASTRPKPAAVSKPAGPRSTAVIASSEPISTGGSAGAAERMSAATPATCGAAMLVPNQDSYAAPGTVDQICSPGATTTTRSERVLNELTAVPPLFVEPTQRTYVKPHG